MADGRQRVADVVGDAAGELAKRGELDLLGLVGEFLGILEEDHGAAGDILAEDLAGRLQVAVMDADQTPTPPPIVTTIVKPLRQGGGDLGQGLAADVRRSCQAGSRRRSSSGAAAALRR